MTSGAVTAIGTVARWLPRHGLARVTIARSARVGDLRARMMGDPAASAEPFAMYEQIRSQGRLVRGRLTWATVDHEICTQILRSDAFGSPLDPARMPRPLRALTARFRDELAQGPVDPPSMLVVDPPDHTRYRRLVSRVFTPRAVEALRHRTEELTTAILDDVEARGAAGAVVDLVPTLAAPLPVTVIAEVLGVPVDRRDDLLRWAGGVAPALDLGLRYREFADVERNARAFNQFMSGHLGQLARNPGDDILSRLVTLEADGEKLTHGELLAVAGLLLGAGFETTVNLIGNGVVTLLRHPDQLRLLRADPMLWAGAVEEILRYDSPVQSTARAASCDTTVDGFAVPAGAVVALLLGGANRDPRRFADPARFDVRRPDARGHLSFSAGIHYCLGAALARMEAVTVLQRLFERFEGLALAGTPLRRSTRTLHGYRSVPVTLG
jgi:cytochrome P450